jgi:hypothetical protein
LACAASRYWFWSKLSPNATTCLPESRSRAAWYYTRIPRVLLRVAGLYYSGLAGLR